MAPSTFNTSHEELTVDENKNETNAMDIDVAKTTGKAHDNWFEPDNLDAMFAERVRTDK